ncbi:MAG: ComEC/Rec2 family competence protein, partial [Ardenticatenaceae bacterium]
MAAPLVPILLAWMIGLLSGEWLPLRWPPWLALSTIALIIGAAVARRHPAKGPLLFHPPVYGTLLTLALLLGAARSAAHRHSFDHTDLATYNDLGRASIRGIVVKYPEVRDGYTRYEIAAREIALEQAEAWQPVEGRFLVNLPHYPAYGYGDVVELSGALVTPPVLDDFDYRAFLAHKGIYSLMRRAQGTLVVKRHGAPLFHLLFGIRRKAERTLQLMLPEPHASLMNGILLGIESGIPDKVMEAFNATGTTHTLVISGANFAVLAAIFLFFGRRLLGERWGMLLAGVGIILYALLVGGDPPVVRAAIMALFTIFALLVRQQGLALNTLA